MAKRAAESSQWETHKETIFELYMKNERPLKEVMEILGTDYAFKRTKAQYERNFNNWGWRRKLKAEEWKSVGRQLEKRKAEGKPDTDLHVLGIYMPKGKIHRGVARHKFQTTLETIEQELSSQSSSQAGTAVRIASPPPTELGALRLQQRLNEALKTVPWMTFQKLIGTNLHGDVTGKPRRNTLFVLQDLPNQPFDPTGSIESDISTLGSRSLSQWTEDLTFNIFFHNSKKYVRLIDLTKEDSFVFLPALPDLQTASRPNLSFIGDINSRTTQEQFLSIAVALLSNNRSDGTIQQVLVDLCSTPRNLAVIKRFLNTKLFSTRSFAEQLLFPAVERQQLSLIKLLLKAGANPLALRWRKDLGLKQIALAGHISVVTERGTGAMVPWRENDEDCALSLAVQLESEDIVTVLLRHLQNAPLYGDRDRTSRKGTSRYGLELAFIKSAGRTRDNMLRIMLETDFVMAGVHDVVSAFMPRVLEYVITADYTDSVNLLIMHFGKSTSMNQEALSMALNSAARRGPLQLAQQLIDLGANLASETENDGSLRYEIPLSLATFWGHIDIVKFFLEQGADPNLFSVQSATPLQIAAMHGNIVMAKLLLDAGANPNISAPPSGFDTAANRSSLKWALLHSNVDIFQILVQYGVELKEGMFPYDTHSVLTLALMSEKMEMIQTLLENNAWPTSDPRDRSFQACVQFHPLSLIEECLQHGADISDAGALCAAIARHDLNILELLTTRMIQIHGSLPPQYSATGLAMASRLTKLDLVSMFLDFGANPCDPITNEIHQVAKHETPHWHGQRKHLQKGTTALLESVTALSSIELVDDSKEAEDIRQCLDVLLEACERIKSTVTGQKQFQDAINGGLQKATYEQTIPIMKRLMQCGADCFAKNTIYPFQQTALELAVETFPQPEFVQVLLEGSPSQDPNSTERQKSLDEALVAAAGSWGPPTLVQLLLKHGADPNYKNCWPLRVSVKRKSRNHVEHVTLLLGAGAKLDTIKESPFMETYLQDAVSRAKPELVQILVDGGADAYNVSMALQTAVEINDKAVVKMLLARGADPNAAPRRGGSEKTAVQHAGLNGNFEIMQMLLEAGGDINSSRGRLCGRTALEGAAEQGFLDMARFLLEMGADVKGNDNKVYRRSVFRAWSEGNLVLAEMIQEFKTARYGVADCVSIEEIVNTMDPFELEVEPYADEPSSYELVVS